MKKLMTLIMALGAIEAFGSIYKIVDGTTNWASCDSYTLDDTASKPEVLPGADDEIYIRAGMSGTLEVDDVASWNVFDGVKRISFQVNDGKKMAVITINMATNATLKVPLVGGANSGKVIKTGAGELTLDSDCKTYGSSTYYFWMLDIQEGSVMCAPNLVNTQNSMSLPIIKVAAGTTFGAPPINGTYYNTARSLCGEGTIASASANKRCEFRLDRTFNWADDPREFAGKFSKDIDFFNPRNINLTGTESEMGYQVRIHFGYNKWGSPGGMIGALKIGNSDGTVSSLGKSASLNFNVYGGVLKYLGEGETSSRNYTVSSTSTKDDYYAGFDGGSNGGWVMTGSIKPNASDASSLDKSYNTMLMLGFGGTNASKRCEFRGNIEKWTVTTNTVYDHGFSMFKRDPGIWLFADNGNGASDWALRNIYGAIRVDEGTLQFDSLNKKGEPCSLGLGDMLYDPHVKVPQDLMANYAVNYNFKLGTAASEGALEAVATNAIDATTRPFALGGNGRLINNGEFRSWYRALAPLGTGARTLTLAGSSTAENSIFDVTDNDSAKISIVKEGEGTWYLKGNQTFRGDIEVKGGTLIATKPSNNNFTWFRLSVQDTQDYGTWGKSQLAIKFMGFYADASNGYNLLSTNITQAAGDRASALEPGQSGYDTITKMRNGSYSTTASKTYTSNIFAISDNYGVFSIIRGTFTNTTGVVFSPTGPILPITVRLGSNATKVDSFDTAIVYGWGSGNKGGFTGAMKIFSLEGSIDGCHWEDANPNGGNWTVTTNDYYSLRADSGWIFAGKESKEDISYNWTGPNATSPRKHTGGCPIKGEATETFEMLNNWSGKVKLSGSGTLKLENATTKAITELTLDESANKLDGFDLATSGTLDITTDKLNEGFTLGTTFANTETLNNVVNWNVKLNGNKKFRNIEIVDGKIVIRKPGMVIIYQ